MNALTTTLHNFVPGSSLETQLLHLTSILWCLLKVRVTEWLISTKVQFRKFALDGTPLFKKRNQSITIFYVYKIRTAVKAAEYNKTIALKCVIIAVSSVIVWKSANCYLFSKEIVRENQPPLSKNTFGN